VDAGLRHCEKIEIGRPKVGLSAENKDKGCLKNGYKWLGNDIEDLSDI
jgi:hypothetical protein